MENVNENLTFESAMAKLEEIVKKMELGTLSLDESVGAFEEATGLIRFCNSELESAKQKVSVLVENADGTVTDRPFDSDET